MRLEPFQQRFIRNATRPDIRTGALSLPRGQGKSALAGHLLTRVLDPADALFRAGTESVLCAASIEQARIVFRFARTELEPRGGYRFLDSHTRIGICHVDTNTRLRVLGSNGRTAMGLVGCPWAICDEPGAWEVNGGRLLHDAIETAKGKPGSPLKVIYIGTLAPAVSGWWHDMIEAGTHGSVYVQALQGRRERWSHWREVMRVNPLAKISADMRERLREERDEAKRDSRLKARFLSYRLNLPSQDEATMLMGVPEWERACAREVGDRAGQPIVGVDLGGGRAWSAAAALFPSGRVEALAVAPGLPSIEDQERRDRVPKGVYQMLADNGSLTVTEGLRVPPPSALWAAVVARWGCPALVVCDRFRLAELWDAVGGSCPVEPRVTRWSEAAADIRALRKMALDGPLSVDPDSRLLLAASLAAARVRSDDQGNTRLAKADQHNNSARDDAAAALVLAAGAQARIVPRPDSFFDGADDPELLAEAEAAVAAERAMLAEIAA